MEGSREGGDVCGGSVAAPPVAVVGEGGAGVGRRVAAEVAVEPGEHPLSDVTGLQIALAEVEFAGDLAAAVSPRLPDHLGLGALGLERPVGGGGLVEVEEGVGLALDDEGGGLDLVEVGDGRDAAGVGEHPLGLLGRVAAGVEEPDGLAGAGGEVQAVQPVDPGRVQARVEERLAFADQVEAVGPLPLEDAGGVGGDAGARAGVVGGERVAEVVPGDQGDEGVDAGVHGGGGQLDRAAVGAADHADARIALGVAGDVVGPGSVVGRAEAAEEVEEFTRRPPVDGGVVEGDQAAGLAEAEARVDETDVAAFGERLADGVRGAVGLAAAEPVGGEDGGGRPVRVDPGGPVEVGVHRAGPAARLDGERQRGDGVRGGLGVRRAGEDEGGGEGRTGEGRERAAHTGNST
ncbi:hypothetical protein SCALM49S_00941 [Streptomyces californicus]